MKRGMSEAGRIFRTDRSGLVDTPGNFRRDVLAGLSRPQKTLPCKYLYDEKGARLFEAICELEEYYPTRTELAILRREHRRNRLAAGARRNLVDLGSGSGLKTRLLLEHLEQPASCLPVDVALTQLLECSARLAEDYPGLEVCRSAPTTRTVLNCPPPPNSGRTTVFFPGSTIGNFEPEEAAVFLRRIGRLCGP